MRTDPGPILKNSNADEDRPGHLLLVEDDRRVREAIADSLRAEGHRVEEAGDCAEARTRLADTRFDLAVCDVCLPDGDGFDLLARAAEHHPDTAVVLLTGYGTIESAVEAIRGGAADYLTKPLIHEELHLAVRRTLAHRRTARENTRLRGQLQQRFGLGAVVGRDYRMRQMYELIESVADTRTTVLVLGESGTGKTVTARAIHQHSDRADKPFIEVACGALPENLLESELFGHVAGSFTGATRDKEGKFLLADGGTLFLDEIATASPRMQVKLLRALQDREFEAVGGTKTHKVDVRLILATNADLEALVKAGEFREDLYYRINVITLTQPALRERVGDIPLLAEHYLEIFREQTGKEVTGIAPEAMTLMQRYRWPGNVRELVNAVERAVVLCRGDEIRPGDLPDALRRDAAADRPPASAHAGSLKEALVEPEREIILEALHACGWNRQDTSRMLNINRTTLYKKMKRYEIDPDRELAGAL